MKTSIVKPVAYFDIFNHPIQKDEIAKLCGYASSEKQFESHLKELVEDKVFFFYNNYYSLQSNVEQLVNERLEKEQLAKSYIKKLPFYVKLIKSFPFVRNISISGSLSKNVMHKSGDVDYFIITKKNRLWICRSLLILFKKVFLLNSRKYFCVNYFVDEDNLEIIDKNIFTAMEVSHLVPVYNLGLLEEMKRKNNWIQEYIPDFSTRSYFTPYENTGVVKTWVEKLFSGRWGDRLDLFFMRITYKRWTQKFNHFNPEKMELTMRSNRGISKHHPSDFQSKVLKAYSERLQRLKINSNESTVYS